MFFVGASRISAPTPLLDFFRADYSSLNQSIREVDWLDIFNNYTSISELYQRFSRVLYSKLFLFAPVRSQKLRQITSPVQIRNLLEQKQRLFAALPNPPFHSPYRKVWKDVDQLLKKF